MSTKEARKVSGATAEEIDEAFDRGEDMREYFDFEHAEVCEPVVVKEICTYRKVNVDFPENVVELLDDYALRMGIARQAVIKQWIWDRLREEQERDLRLGVPPLAERSSVVVIEPGGQRAGKARGKAKGKAGQWAKSKGRDVS